MGEWTFMLQIKGRNSSFCLALVKPQVFTRMTHITCHIVPHNKLLIPIHCGYSGGSHGEDVTEGRCLKYFYKTLSKGVTPNNGVIWIMYEKGKVNPKEGVKLLTIPRVTLVP